MNDGDFLVDILDKNGQVTHTKLRKDIVKGQDIYHAVYCVLITPEDKVAISKIADRQDLPNLHAGSYGCTAATVKRTAETGHEAMSRALKNELNVDVTPELLDESMQAVDNTYRKVGLYFVKSQVPEAFSKQDIQEIIELDADEFNKVIAEQQEKVTPLLKLFWEKYQAL